MSFLKKAAVIVFAASFVMGAAVSPAKAACVNPAGTVGEIFYNQAQSVLQYCDNTNWIAAGPQIPEVTQGYFVMASGTYTGNFGGLSGADATCLSDLNNNDWMGKSSAGPLSEARVKAFLCDGLTCNNLAPSSQYNFAHSNIPATGGASFTTDATARGPGDSNNWSGATRFGVSANIWMNRGEGTGQLWMTTPELFNNHCSNWTISSPIFGEYGASGQTDARRWTASSGACTTLNRLICAVQPTAAGTCTSPTGAVADIMFNSAENVMQYCNGISWIAMGPVGGVSAGGACDTTPVVVTTPGSSTFNIPANCNSVTVQAYGAGGSGALDSQNQRGAGGGGGSSAVVKNTGSVLLVVGGGGGGGGGVDGAPSTQSRGGGGGYATATVAVTPGEQLNVFVGGGGVQPSLDTGGAGGATGTYAGGKGGNRRQNGTGMTYGGGGGGGGVENTGGSSTYGGAGGAGDEGGSCGTSTNGGACSGNYGGGGGGFSVSGGLVMTGSAGNVSAGAAANGGPGSGAQNATGGNGRVVLTPAPGMGGSGCLSPAGVAGDLLYNTAANALQYCDGDVWISVGK